MSPRTGRPPSKNPKNRRIEIRMTKEEEEKLDYCCGICGKTRSEIAREGIALIYEKLRKLEQK